MRFAVDVDGVCADSFIDLGIDPKNIKKYDFSDLSAAKRKKILDAFDTETYWRDLKTVPGSQEAIQALSFMGHEIVFVTSPWMKTAHNWAALRTQWIRKHYGDYPVICTEHKELVSADILIDDKLETCLRTHEAWMKRQRGERVSRPYIFGIYGYNQGSHLTTFADWDEVLIHFTEQFT